MNGYSRAGCQELARDYDSPKSARPVTIRQEILGQIAYFKEVLAKKEAMLKLLDENPAIEQFMDLSRG